MPGDGLAEPLSSRTQSRTAMQHLLIADAGPLIALARIHHLHLLQQLFRRVTIPFVVAKEVGWGILAEATTLSAGAAALNQAHEQGWLLIDDPRESALDQPLNPGVDAGEASAIALAIERRIAGDDVLLLIDDRCGRAEARRHDLAVIGTAAVLVLAREQDLVPACGPLLQALRLQGYYLSDQLIQAP